MADTAVAAACAAIGSAACFLTQVIGIEPAALFWAFSGAGFGLGVPRESTRIRLIIAFPFAILGGSALGALSAESWFGGTPRAIASMSFIAGFVIHPAGEKFLKHLEPLLAWGMDRLGVRR